eukprot:CAMPEP_0172652276 /NCGR_PEP_ID=MMETSP1068-20121228/243234_1 /TAXON_ID=35684 /ORGANISM="Pseudopedinella elastica, Strain CCMP716" /LENGTH=416 /DNA_ID=CAMNT_0013466683 /DNA_START=1795 /DNA_END=3045 /DNA_ORIENTATION=-
MAAVTRTGDRRAKSGGNLSDDEDDLLVESSLDNECLSSPEKPTPDELLATAEATYDQTMNSISAVFKSSNEHMVSTVIAKAEVLQAMTTRRRRSRSGTRVRSSSLGRSRTRSPELKKSVVGEGPGAADLQPGKDFNIFEFRARMEERARGRKAERSGVGKGQRRAFSEASGHHLGNLIRPPSRKVSAASSSIGSKRGGGCSPPSAELSKNEDAPMDKSNIQNEVIVGTLSRGRDTHSAESPVGATRTRVRDRSPSPPKNRSPISPRSRPTTQIPVSRIRDRSPSPPKVRSPNSPRANQQDFVEKLPSGKPTAPYIAACSSLSWEGEDPPPLPKVPAPRIIWEAPEGSPLSPLAELWTGALSAVAEHSPTTPSPTTRQVQAAEASLSDAIYEIESSNFGQRLIGPEEGEVAWGALGP